MPGPKLPQTGPEAPVVVDGRAPGWPGAWCVAGEVGEEDDSFLEFASIRNKGVCFLTGLC